MSGMRIAIGADNAGVQLKNVLRDQLRDDPRVGEVRDVGVPDEADSTDYPLVALDAARAVAQGEVDRAILICTPTS